MDIQIHNVKQYNGPQRKVLTVDGVPMVIGGSCQRLESLSAYLQGYTVEIADKKVKKRLDQIRETNATAP